MAILGIDPGFRNFAVSLTEDGKVVETAMISHTLTDLKVGARKQLFDFHQEMS